MKSLAEILNPGKEKFFYRNGEKILLKPVTDKVLVKFKSNTPVERKQAAFDSLKESTGLVHPHRRNKDSANGDYHLMDVDHSNPRFRTENTVSQLQVNTTDNALSHIGSVFENSDERTYLALTDQFFIKLKAGDTIDKVKPELDKYGVINVEDMEGGLYLITVDNSSNLDTLEIANELYESGLVEFADPNFFRSLINLAYTPNDPNYYSEWHIPVIGANNAWCWTNGSNVLIGIMDVGINTSHPDLAANYQGTYDPTGQPLGVDSHGTLCAGAACEVANNSIGGLGVAWGAKFRSIRIGYNNTGDPNNNSFYSIDSWVVGGFNDAKNNNVAVVSCSFSLGSHTNSTDSAIATYTSQGRGGNGGLVFAATGNDGNTNIGYPASNTNVFAVGATDQSDNRASFSNYGTKVAIAAPGVYIPTTSYTGGYEPYFSGTSAATPIAAACSALVMQLNPTYSRNAVFGVLATYADKVNGPYTGGYTYGSMNQYVGYGRVNINNYLSSIYYISGPSNYCGTTDQYYYFNNLPAGMGVSWSSSNPNMPVNPNSGLVSNIGGHPDETILTATLTNNCTQATKYVVQGALAQEVYAIEQDSYRPLNWTFAGGNNPSYYLNVPNNAPSYYMASIMFGYGPSKNKSVIYAPLTTHPDDVTDTGWVPDSTDLTSLTLLSAPATWSAGFFGNILYITTSGDATGTLVVRAQIPCGDTVDVSFNIIGY